jgi:sec-independent protein translocase protein TatA
MIGAGGLGAPALVARTRPDPVAEEIMFGLGMQELLLIFVILVLIFGTSRIPELGRGLGEGIKNFKKSIKGDEEPEKKP